MALVMAMSLSGCPSDPPPDPGCWTEPAPDAPLGEVELGLGGGTFTRVAERDPIELQTGTQGLHHFILRSRTRGMLAGEDGSTATMFGAFDEDGQKIDILECPYQLPYEPSPDVDDFLLLREDIFLIIDEAYVPSIDGRSLLFRVEVIDADGRYARDERTLIAEYTPPADVDAGAE
jgi:hypothetical protein